VSAPDLTAYGDLLPPSLYGPAPLPRARGPQSEWLLSTLARQPGTCSMPPAPTDDPVTGDDSALTLYLLYELHYRGLQGVDDGWEWQPELLAARHRLEQDFVARLRDAVPMPPSPEDVAAELRRRAEPSDEPSLCSFCEEEGTWEQLRELFVHRTAWQLKEADPHSWALPRLGGRPKAALAEIQSGEYGEGVERDVHQNLYALTLSLMDLDTRYGAYLDLLPGVTLATVNLVSFFGLHRTWLPAMIGHLSMFEMTSVPVMSAYAAALRRLEAPQDACHFFEVHVVADAHHQNVAADGLAAGLHEQDPAAGRLILFGADALMWSEAQFSEHVKRSWDAGRTSLLGQLDTEIESTG
jgi:hypothetical protein